VASNQVSANYFATLGIPILRGRAIERNDAACGMRSVCPVVVSQEFAREYLNGSDVIGKTLRTPDGGILEIVGIAANVASSPVTSLSQPVVYRAWPSEGPPLQAPFSVRVIGDAESLSASMNAILRTAYPGAEIDTRTIRSFLERDAEVFGRLVALIGVLGVLGILLAVIGIYGVVSFAVTKRTKEMGIRIALGAMKRDIYATVVGSSLRPIWVGLLVGLLLALAGARLLQQALARFLPLDYYNPLSYTAPACLMFVVSLLAITVPAGRAARCDPSKTLREE
jgi:ABC-type antimicrobial peptide transport system permease subunit